MDKTKTDACEKILLAEGLGVRVLYCAACEVVELEIGAISLRLSPQSVQRIANLMMKASLKLDRVEHKFAANAATDAPLLH